MSRLNALAEVNLTDLDTTDKVNLSYQLTVAFGIQSQSLCLIAPSGVFFVLSLITLLLLKRHLKTCGNAKAGSRRSRLRRLAMGLCWFSIAFAIAAATAITQSISCNTREKKVSRPHFQSRPDKCYKLSSGRWSDCPYSTGWAYHPFSRSPMAPLSRLDMALLGKPQHLLLLHWELRILDQQQSQLHVFGNFPILAELIRGRV